jgi:iron complex outermembrane recepter protein
MRNAMWRVIRRQIAPVGEAAVLFLWLTILSCPVANATRTDAASEDRSPIASEHEGAQQLETVTVTATRVTRPHYESPTPTTVLGAEILDLRKPNTLADALVLLPAMRNAQDEGTGSLVFGVGVGRGFENLRGLGPNRTLVLLDGERLTANSLSSAPDISLLPGALVKRIEVVTGGASAAYGSDAVAGVVNVILDSDFRGFRADLEGGTSYRGDASLRKISLTGGGDIVSGIHVVASVEHFDRNGLPASARDFATPSALVPNPATGAGQRPLVLVGNAYDAGQAYGGLILNGPLEGNQFLSTGAVAPYVPPSCTINQPYVLCNSRQSLAASSNAIALTSPQRRDVAFARATADITSETQWAVDALLARSETSITSIPFDSVVLGIDLPIDVTQNPFLPSSVRNAYRAAGISTLLLGRLSTDEGVFQDSLVEKEGRLGVGLKTKLGGSWSLQAHSIFSIADDDDRWLNDYNVAHLLNAVDSVLVNGVATCRINAARITDPACSPANVIGSGNLSAEAKSYFLGTLRDPLRTSNFSFSTDLRGESLETRAGRVSLATGLNYREEKADQSSSGTFVFTGYPAFSGHIRVTELYGEAVVPLINAHSQIVDLDAGVRWSDYSSSGSKFPWKLGLNWSPHPGIRARFTLSEDIRAPNIAELNTPRFLSSFETAVNPPPNGIALFNSLGVAPGSSLNVRDVEGGNPDLRPEVAHTLAEGIVIEPTLLPRLMLSIDHYRIEVANAIAELPVSQIIAGCAAGSQSTCSLISISPTSNLPLVTTRSVNAASLLTSGIDAELRVHGTAGGGEASLRVLANYMLEYHQAVPGVSYQDLEKDLGSGLPALQADIGASYAKRGFTGFLHGTFVGGGYYDKSMAALIENDHVSHVWYVGAGLSWDMTIDGRHMFAMYANVNNLFNQAPPSVGFGTFSSLSNGALIGVPYDRIGRFFKLGLRVQM